MGDCFLQRVTFCDHGSELGKRMKLIFWGVVATFAAIVIVTGCLALTSKPTYDEPAHREKIAKIYPSVQWSAYRDAAREICGLGDEGLRHVRTLAVEQGPEAEQAMIVNVTYMCPDRLATVAR